MSDDKGGDYDQRPEAHSDISHLVTRDGPFEPTYNPHFLGHTVPVPVDTLDDSLEVGGSVVTPYTHYCLAISKSRRLPRWAAWNIDGRSLKKTDRVDFYRDRRLAPEQQVLNDAYSNNELDRGHIARRADLIWGPDDEAVRANNQSMAYPNITPQMDNFNQSSQAGDWGNLENAVQNDDRLEHKRVTVIGGPIFAGSDRIYRAPTADVRLPQSFFKVVIYAFKDELRARTFILDQNFDGLRDLWDLDAFRIAPVAIEEVTAKTGLDFGRAVAEADGKWKKPGIVPLEPEWVDDVSDLRW